MARPQWPSCIPENLVSTMRFDPPISMIVKAETVLITDDDEGMGDDLCAILKREYQILLAAAREEALNGPRCG